MDRRAEEEDINKKQWSKETEIPSGSDRKLLKSTNGASSSVSFSSSSASSADSNLWLWSERRREERGDRESR